MINICIYEDTHYQQLFPLTFAKPAYALLLGINKLINKIEQFFDYGNISLHCRNEIKSSLKELFPQYPINTPNNGAPCLFINGRVVITKLLFNHLAALNESHNYLLLHKGQVVAAYLRGELLDQMIQKLQQGVVDNTVIIETFRKKAITKQLDHCLILQFPWDLNTYNQEIVSSDFNYANQLGIIKGELKPYVSIYNENNVFIGKHSIVEDFVVLDASNGPIYIEDHVHIQAHTRIEGPTFIGAHTRLLGGSIRSSSIGPHCKIAGEVNQSIFLGYSNKAHDGFIGNSYIGEWVNLGAFTTTSNLKNNYKPVQVSFNNAMVDTKEQFIGAFIGDYVKTGIHTTFNTGTHIGFGSTLFNAGLHQKYIPPFSWGEPNSLTTHQFEQFITTTKTVMSRRNQSLSKTKHHLFNYLFQTYAQ